jgi:hypothetical protein
VPHDKTVTRTSAASLARVAGTYAQNGDIGTCRIYHLSALVKFFNLLIKKEKFTGYCR